MSNDPEVKLYYKSSAQLNHVSQGMSSDPEVRLYY